MAGATGPDIEVIAEDRGGVLVLQIRASEVTMFTSPEIREKVLAALAPKPKRVVMDLSHIGYMDSSGIAIVFKAIQIVSEYGGKFAAAGLNKSLQKVMHLVTKTPNVSYFESTDLAVTAMAGG